MCCNKKSGCVTIAINALFLNSASTTRLAAPRDKESAVKVLEIRVLPDVRQIKLTVEMPLSCYHTAQAPHLSRGLFRLLPGLASHTCHNDAGQPFKKEARYTEIPHIFEHLLLELQRQAQHADDLTLRGTTEWNWLREPHGRFHVFVEYENQLLAVGVITLAERILASLDRRDLSDLDMDKEIERLRDLARLGRELNGYSETMPQSAESTRGKVTSRAKRPTIASETRFPVTTH